MAARERLSAIVVRDIDQLVSNFYETFLAHDDAAIFLSHSVVHERLSHSLRNWILELVSADPLAGMTAFDERQVKIGEVHARIKIPIHLVLEGASLLKTEIGVRVSALGLDAQTTSSMLMMLGEIVDYSMRLMSKAYFSNTQRRVRTDEAFRLFSLGQDINLERETQRAALMEWSQAVLFDLLAKRAPAAPVSLEGSAFGLWVRHRAAVLFQGAAELATIQRLIRDIDADVLPSIDGADPSTVQELQVRVDELKFLLNDLFQAAASIENGRDALTRTLNRRFLPSVLGREIALANEGRSKLSVLMVDIDRFKTINDQYGHSAGDVALRHTAELLLAAVRSSDFVFRYGGEEFLIVLVETGAQEATAIAERIRQEVAREQVQLADNHALSLTVSVGVATHDGHPDYEYLVNAADRALYAAKRAGRDQVALAPVG